jgi:hypothetical protein
LNKSLAYILLFLFVFNSMGYYFIFEIHKYHVKKEMQTRADKASYALTILKVADPVNNREFQRVEKKEIRYKGSLYDVIKEIKTGSTTIFYCLHDKKEENLLAAMKKVNKNIFLVSLWDHVIKIAVPPSCNFMAVTLKKRLMFPQISVPLPSFLLGTWSPPPELT